MYGVESYQDWVLNNVCFLFFPLSLTHTLTLTLTLTYARALRLAFVSTHLQDRGVSLSSL